MDFAQGLECLEVYTVLCLIQNQREPPSLKVGQL